MGHNADALGCTVVTFAVEVLHHAADADLVDSQTTGEWCSLGVFSCDSVNDGEQDGLSFYHWSSDDESPRQLQHGRRMQQTRKPVIWPPAVHTSAVRLRVLEYCGSGHISLRFVLHTTPSPGFGRGGANSVATTLKTLRVGHNEYAVHKDAHSGGGSAKTLLTALQNDRLICRLLQRLALADDIEENGVGSEERMRWWLDGRDWSGSFPRSVRTVAEKQALICGGLWLDSNECWTSVSATINADAAPPAIEWVPAARLCPNLHSAERDMCEWLPFLQRVVKLGNAATARSPVRSLSSSSGVQMRARSPRDRSGRWTMPRGPLAGGVSPRRRIPPPATTPTRVASSRPTGSRFRSPSPSTKIWSFNNTYHSLSGQNTSSLPDLRSEGGYSARIASLQSSEQPVRAHVAARRRLQAQEDATRVGTIRVQREYQSSLRRQFNEAEIRGEKLRDVTALV